MAIKNHSFEFSFCIKDCGENSALNEWQGAAAVQCANVRAKAERKAEEVCILPPGDVRKRGWQWVRRRQLQVGREYRNVSVMGTVANQLNADVFPLLVVIQLKLR